MKKKVTKSAVALLIAIALIAVGGIGTVLAALGPKTEELIIPIKMDHVGVELLENGSAANGQLALGLGGVFEPGKMYKEEIAAQNTTDTPIYVRTIVRKYWTDKDGIKVEEPSPDQIILKYGGEPYNTSAWQINAAESTAESETYYLSSVLAGGAASDPLFDLVGVDGAITASTETVDNGDGSSTTTTSYSSEFDGYIFNIEATVEGIQTHNGQDAINSEWGVSNVSVSGTGLSVN